jgi:hypothetical protein
MAVQTYKDYINLEKEKNIKFLEISKDNIPKKTANKTLIKCLNCDYNYYNSYSELKRKHKTKCPNCIKITYNNYLLMQNKKEITFLNISKGELPLPKGRGFLSKMSKHFHSRHFEIRAVPALIF